MYTSMEDQAVQQFTGMHYSGGQDVQAVCRGMALKQTEWDNIKKGCSWLNAYEIAEIEEYLTRL